MQDTLNTLCPEPPPAPGRPSMAPPGPTEQGFSAAHRRVTKTLGTSVRHFYHSKRWQDLEEYVGTTKERLYVWGNRHVDDLVLRDWSSAGNGNFDDRRYALHDSFNVTGTVNTSGTVQERYGYAAYGALRLMNSGFNSVTSSSGTSQMTYAGCVADWETGFYLARRRYLHPGLGRFVNRDPIGYHGGNNLYAYVADAPVNGVDPWGLEESRSSSSSSSALSLSSTTTSEYVDHSSDPDFQALLAAAQTNAPLTSTNPPSATSPSGSSSNSERDPNVERGIGQVTRNRQQPTVSLGAGFTLTGTGTVTTDVVLNYGAGSSSASSGGFPWPPSPGDSRGKPQ